MRTICAGPKNGPAAPSRTIPFDATSVADIERVVATVAAEAGRLDALVNTVGVSIDLGTTAGYGYS